MSKKISVIVSVFNEENGLERSYQTIRQVLEEYTAGRNQSSISGQQDTASGDAPGSREAGGRDQLGYELLFVNDGSQDESGRILEVIRKKDPEHVSVVSFSRNFGHEAAMTAGLDYASGDWLIFMDADLQHPPACIPEIMEQFDAGYNVINMVRTRNATAGLGKNITSGLYYSLINRISEVPLEPAASDFFAMDRQAAEVLKHNYREKVRFLRGFVQNIGFRKTKLEYEAGARVAGHSHYSFKKLWKLSLDSIICFSNLPLKLGIYAGFGTGLLGVLLIIYTLLTRKGAPSGYATIVIVLCFMFAMLFMLLGILGGYIGIIFREIQDRPIYIVENAELVRKED